MKAFKFYLIDVLNVIRLKKAKTLKQSISKSLDHNRNTQKKEIFNPQGNQLKNKTSTKIYYVTF